MIDITVDLANARLAGTQDFLDAGVNNAEIRIYGDTRPATPATVPTSAMLVAIPLAKPSGTISGGVLTLVALEDGLIQESGTATWARIVNGAGVTAFDCDAGEGPGTWEVQLAQVALFAGGEAKLVSAALG